MSPVPLQSEGLAALARIRHGFFSRRGGVSEGIYASLNCGFGSGDAREAVAENRGRVAGAMDLGNGRLNTVYQVHGTNVAEVTAPWPPEAAPKADAMVSRTAGVGLGILAADCTPVLFADGEAGVIGAAHAGWRGALAGVVEATIAAMLRLGADRRRLAAAIGPCIGAASYEVGPELRQQFVAVDPGYGRHFTPSKRDGHYQLDLPGFVAGRLSAAGVGRIDRLDEDTYSSPDRFFSYRRATHRGEPDYGRNISVIALG